MAGLVLASELPGAGGRLPSAAALAVAAAHGGAPVILAEVGGARGRGPTMLGAESARSLEARLRGGGFESAARGHLAWLRLEPDGWNERLEAALELVDGTPTVVAVLEPTPFGAAVEAELGARAALLRADLPRQRSLAALAVTELRGCGIPVRISRHQLGRVAARRALAGIDPGGGASRRSARQAAALLGERPPSPPGGGLTERRLATESGQALPLVLGGILTLVACTLALAAIGGAVTGKARVQRAADLAALSAAREMRDQFDRLFVAARRPDGSLDPEHLAKREYLDRAEAAAVQAARRNGVEPRRLAIEFPDRASFAPLRVRAEISAELDAGAQRLPLSAHAEAEAVPASAAPVAGGGPAVASGGGYSGPLVYRQGAGMRPDVAAAFDRMAAAAAADGVSLLVNDGFRSDAEQAELWAQNPDPTWVAPPGTSLHRCATELDLGPPSAYAWLAANAGRFGFTQRYPWEAWHFGFTAGPAPCSAVGDAVGWGDPGTVADGASGAVSLPGFVPARFREPLAAAARRWDVSGALLAAQLMAESNFNPFAVSPAGAAGIAQFMPATAAAYGLDDPFDAEAAIDAQAHLMADLLAQFGDPSLALAAYNAGPGPVQACDCVPPFPETQAYVARILGLIDGAGVTVAGGPPQLEVRLVD